MSIMRLNKHLGHLHDRAPTFVSANQLRDYARLFAPDAINLLVETVHDSSVGRLARLTAARDLLDRGFGKPVQQIVIDELDDAKVIDMVSEAEDSVNQIMLLPAKQYTDDADNKEDDKPKDHHINGHIKD